MASGELLTREEHRKLIENVANAFESVKSDVNKEWRQQSGEGGLPPVVGLLVFGSVGAGVDDINPPRTRSDVDATPLIRTRFEGEENVWTRKVSIGLEKKLGRSLIADMASFGILDKEDELDGVIYEVQDEGKHLPVTLIYELGSGIDNLLERIAISYGIGLHSIPIRV